MNNHYILAGTPSARPVVINMKTANSLLGQTQGTAIAAPAHGQDFMLTCVKIVCGEHNSNVAVVRNM
jgi:hypothetical protein